MNLNQDKFEALFRYLIKVAQDKRVVMYHELENIFQLSHNMVGDYAGLVGDFCFENDLPLLNSLVVSAQECCPSVGFDLYLKKSGHESWGDCAIECWKTYHVTSSRSKQVENFTGLRDLMSQSQVLQSHYN